MANDSPCLKQGDLHPWQKAVREAYTFHETPRHPKKALVTSDSGETQGAIISDKFGLISPKPDKLVRLCAMLNWVLIHQKISLRQLQVVCGHLVYFASFRRPLMVLFQQVWVFMSTHTRVDSPQGREWLVARTLPDSVLDEIWLGLLLLPLACIDLKVPLSPMVTVSDASESGGGVCYSTGISSSGVKALKLWFS